MICFIRIFIGKLNVIVLGFVEGIVLFLNGEK